MCLAVALLTAWAIAPASDAVAAEQLWLRWSDCAPTGPPGMTLNCTIPAFSRNLYASACPAAALSQVVAANLVFDVVTDSATLPDWWKLGPGDCRDGQLGADTDFSATVDCADAWGGAGVSLVQVFGNRPGGGANQTRFVVAAGVPGNQSVTLPADQPVALARVFMFLSDVVTTTCAGCGVGACLVLNSVEVVRLPGAPGGDVTLFQPGEPGGNYATWQSGAACVSVPARNRSWGQIKALYR